MPRAFSGVFTAIPTPFKDGKVDCVALGRQVERQVEGGVAGVVAVGTTGESPTLTAEEHLQVIRVTIDHVRGRCRVIAGTGSNCTAEAVEYTRKAANLGADATLQVVPYYNKPQQRGMVEHFRAVAESAGIPHILYNVPGRCGAQLDVETVVQIAREIPNVAGIKDAHGDVARVAELRAALDVAGRRDFSILAGDDSQTLPFMARGADGVVSVASNVAPAGIVEMVAAQAEGRLENAQRLAEKFRKLFSDLFIEPNPVPVKAALAMMYPGVQSAEVRLPLVGLTPDNASRLRHTLGLA